MQVCNITSILIFLILPHFTFAFSQQTKVTSLRNNVLSIMTNWNPIWKLETAWAEIIFPVLLAMDETIFFINFLIIYIISLNASFKSFTAYQLLRTVSIKPLVITQLFPMCLASNPEIVKVKWLQLEAVTPHLHDA